MMNNQLISSFHYVYYSRPSIDTAQNRKGEGNPAAFADAHVRKPQAFIQYFEMAERERFELSREVTPPTGLANPPLQPLG
jgi:hypothetical protein